MLTYCYYLFSSKKKKKIFVSHKSQYNKRDGTFPPNLRNYEIIKLKNKINEFLKPIFNPSINFDWIASILKGYGIVYGTRVI